MATERSPSVVFPAHGRRGLAHEHVHLAGLECRKALLTGERDEPHLGGITQDGCGDGPADVRVESAPSALTVGWEKPATPVSTPQASAPEPVPVQSRRQLEPHRKIQQPSQGNEDRE